MISLPSTLRLTCGRWFRGPNYRCACLLAVALTAAAPVRGGDKLYGVHWWDYANPTVGSGPDRGWSVETVVTHSAPWWQAPYFAPLYQTLDESRDVSLLTRIDYDWGQTIPAPGNPDAAGWPGHVVNQVVGVLGNHGSRWVIGNEPNIIGEGNGWTDNRITPAAYAATYHAVRVAIKAVRPHDEVLFAPVSPGGVIHGVRWMAGNDWLDEAIQQVRTLPGGDIDGFAIHAYGNPYASATVAAAGFQTSYAEQLAVIDGHGFHDKPVYLTEWSRSTATSGNLAANEQVTADFIRLAIDGIHAWNQTLGAHNIAGTAWFVYNQDYGGWENQSLEWWRTRGHPVGHPGDLWTALESTGSYPAGMVGTRPWGDFHRDGQVDGTDLAVWRSEFGTAGENLLADANGNGVVDLADYTMWRDTLSAGLGPVPATPALGNRQVPVPEPRAVVLLVLAAGWLRRPRAACPGGPTVRLIAASSAVADRFGQRKPVEQGALHAGTTAPIAAGSQQ